MAPRKDLTSGIQILPNLVRKVLDTLTSDTAVEVTTAYTTGLTRDFLLKKIRMQFQIEDFTRTKSLIIGFARGDMTMAEIVTALATQLLDPEDFQLWDSFANNKGIFWETLRSVTGVDVGDTNITPTYNFDISIGGGKGIPLEAAHGIQCFAFNPDGGTVGNAGSTFQGAIELIGIFMEGSN